MRMRIVAIIGVVLSLCVGVQSVHAFGIRPYVRVGYLITPPTAAELEFEVVGGPPAAAQEGLDMNRLNYGLGGQLFFVENGTIIKGSTIRVGIEASVHRLFSSVHTGAYQSTHKDSETALAFLVLGELKPEKMPVFFQLGLGPEAVLWSWEYEYTGPSYQYKSDSGVGISPVIMAAAGMDLPISDAMSVPIMLRLDNIFRYGTLTSISVVAALNVKL